MTDTELLTATQYALLWTGAGLLMLISATGHWLDLWPLTNPVWWLALVALIALVGTETYEYVARKRET